MRKEVDAATNIVLIGMPWCGKSTIGVLLAKVMMRRFVDTDLVIQAGEKRQLQEIIDTEGVEQLRALEEDYVCNLAVQHHVIATGGSVVYSDKAMWHLRENGVCVYLRLPLSVLETRATHVSTRGLVRAPGQTLRDLYEERTPRYEKWADVVVDGEGLTHEQVLEAVLKALQSEEE